jgi:tripartite-type tricarboxylate transporter receptor subunit TctC
VASPALPLPAGAQAYPSRPVRIVVGYAAGGGTDIAARVMGHWLSERLGQQFIIENRPGAATNIATEAVARSAPDGYTLLLVTSANAINATYYEKLSFDFMQDIAPVGAVMRVPLVMVVNPSFPVKTVAELIAYAKANPRKISYASGGAGGPDHMAAEYFKLSTGTEMLHVPYRGLGPALTDLIGGQVQLIFATMPAAIEYIKADRLRALAVTTERRRCRRCRSWPMSCQASRRANGTRSARRRAPPPTSSRPSTKRCSPAWPMPRSGLGSPSWAACPCR